MKRIICNEWYFKVALIFTLLCTTTHYTMKIYSILIYIILLWGILIGINLLYKNVDILINPRINILLTAFILLNVITIFANLRDNFFKNAAVLVSTSIFFMIYFFNSKKGFYAIEKEMKYIGWIILIWSMMQGIIELVLFLCKICIPIDVNGNVIFLGYNVRGEGILQLSGIADNLTTVGLLAVIGIIFSIYLLIKYFYRVIYRMIILANILIQFAIISFTNNLTSILSCIIGIIIITFLITYKKVSVKRNQVVIMFILPIITMCVMGSFLFATYKAIGVIPQTIYSIKDVEIEESVENTKEKKIEVKTERNLKENLETGSGRYAIWKEAVALWKEKPILGHGYKNSIVTINDGRVYGHMHNVFVQVLVGNGIIAAVILLLFFMYHIGLILMRILRKMDFEIEWIFNVAFVVSIICFNMLNSNIVFERTIMAFVFWNSIGFFKALEDNNI